MCRPGHWTLLNSTLVLVLFYPCLISTFSTSSDCCMLTYFHCDRAVCSWLSECLWYCLFCVELHWRRWIQCCRHRLDGTLNTRKLLTLMSISCPSVARRLWFWYQHSLVSCHSLYVSSMIVIFSVASSLPLLQFYWLYPSIHVCFSTVLSSTAAVQPVILCACNSFKTSFGIVSVG